MNRKSFIQSTAMAGGLLLFTKYESFAKLVEKAGFEIKMLTNEIGIFNEKGGTILFYLGKKGITIVDTQFPDSVAHLIEELKKKTDKPFELVINTHHHGDHTSGNIAFKDLVKKVVAHQNSLTNQKAAAEKQKTEDKQLFPNKVFTDKWKAKLGKEKVVLNYYGAAHTNGDIVVHFTKSNVIHVGDLVFNRRFPYIDKSSGANIKSWITVLQKIQSNYTDDAKFICGHSNDKYTVQLTKSDIKAFENYLTQLLYTVQQAINDRKSKEEIMKIKTIVNAPEWSGDGIERSLMAAYMELFEQK